jgi:2-keto-3-deoxy-L-rhamnonate aldolase RhmA
MRTLAIQALAFVLASATPALSQTSAAIDLWNQDKVAFGVFVPNEASPERLDGIPKTTPRQPGAPQAEARPPAVYTKAGGEKLAANPLYDFVFLNLEPRFDPGAIKATAEGLRSGGTPRKTLIVRIPTPEADGLEAVKVRIKRAFDLGADGVTVPHVRSVDEAKQVLAFFRDAKVNIWSPSNPNGDRLAMLMLEDPGAVAQAKEIAALPGYSILACGIGSLAQVMGGNREAAESGTQQVLAETKNAKLVNMLTTSTRDVEQRVKEGFLGLIAQGKDADDAIKAGRAAAGRQP